MDPNTGVLSREPHRVVAVVVAPDLTGAWMSVRDNGGTLWWTVTFVSSENQVTEDALPVFNIADVSVDPDNTDVFCVYDARGVPMKRWNLHNYPPEMLEGFVQQVASARLPDLYGVVWERKDEQAVKRCEPISQLAQDLWVLQVLGRKRGGYFVDVGAGDGILISNTLRLERDFGWKGIAVEPSRQFEALQRNRGCHCVKACIGKESEEVVYVEDYLNGEHNHFSGIKKYNDCHKQKGTEVKMTTRSLTSVLLEQRAPKDIDFLSLDTEGSELVILQSVAFDQFVFKLIALEHNYVEPRRTQMRELLQRNEYVHIPIASSRWDDFYIHQSHLHQQASAIFTF